MTLASANLKVTVHINMWSPLKTRNKNMERKNEKIRELEMTLNEMAVKMFQLELNQKEMELNDDVLIKTKEDATRITSVKKVVNKTGNTKDQQGKKFKLKVHC